MIGVLQFPGSNCDMDIIHAIKEVLGEEAKLVFFKEQDLSGLDGIIIPGGFTYGDHLRVGAIAAKLPVMDEIKELAREGVPILGICNGFQILCEAGLLPGALTTNTSTKFISRWEGLTVRNDTSLFMKKYKKGENVRMPIAHGGGRYYCDEKTLESLWDNNQVAFTYDNNPNGSVDDIAGICNKEGNVLGLMPHPERASERVLGGDDGIKMFEAMLNHIKSER